MESNVYSGILKTAPLSCDDVAQERAALEAVSSLSREVFKRRPGDVCLGDFEDLFSAKFTLFSNPFSHTDCGINSAN